jgi:hypothetical protein
MTREELAQRVASGLAGWFQLRDAEGVGSLHGEEAARLALVQLLRAQAAWRVGVSEQPDGWKRTGLHLDLALLPWGQDATSTYGTLELKWPGNVDIGQTRLALVQDAVRVASVKSAGKLRAAFVVMGCRGDAETEIFDTVHPKAAAKEKARKAFGALFSRDLAHPEGIIERDRLDEHFPKFAKRVPAGPVVNLALKTTLLSREEAHRGGATLGRVFVWHCGLRPGPPA